MAANTINNHFFQSHVKLTKPLWICYFILAKFYNTVVCRSVHTQWIWDYYINFWAFWGSLNLQSYWIIIFTFRVSIYIWACTAVSKCGRWNWYFNQSINQSVSQSVSQSVYQPIHLSTVINLISKNIIFFPCCKNNTSQFSHLLIISVGFEFLQAGSLYMCLMGVHLFKLMAVTICN